MVKNPCNVLHTLESIVLCIRFPFLYKRNRYTGRYYTPAWYTSKLMEIDNKVSFCEYVSGKTLRSRYYRIVLKLLTVLSYVNIFRYIPTSTWLDNLPYGWKQRFAIDMCKEIKRALKRRKRKGDVYHYFIYDVKEKRGELCWHASLHSYELEKIIDKYEDIAYHTCIECGNVAEYCTDTFGSYCEEHMTELAERFKYNLGEHYNKIINE